jgi:hypothetical protein
MVWIPVVSSAAYWQIPVAQISIGWVLLASNTTAIIDSGTSLIAGPRNAVQLINQFGAQFILTIKNKL